MEHYYCCIFLRKKFNVLSVITVQKLYHLIAKYGNQFKGMRLQQILVPKEHKSKFRISSSCKVNVIHLSLLFCFQRKIEVYDTYTEPFLDPIIFLYGDSLLNTLSPYCPIPIKNITKIITFDLLIVVERRL